MEQFGKLYISTARRIAGTEGMGANELRLIVWVFPHTRSGNRLTDPKDIDNLHSWMAENAPNLDVKDVQVVSFSLLNAANEVFNGHKTEASRQVHNLIEHGILSKAGRASRGHSQLYVVDPDRYTLQCVPKATNEYTMHDEKVHIMTRIGTQPEVLNREDETPTESLHQTYNSSLEFREKPSEDNMMPNCPKCRTADNVKFERGCYECTACDYVFAGRPREKGHDNSSDNLVV